MVLPPLVMYILQLILLLSWVLNWILESLVKPLATPAAVAYCLVHVREGYNANSITYPAVTDDMYNPTNDVIISGVLTDGSTEDHKYARIGRKMKPGDRIALLYYLSSTTGTVNVSLK